MDTERKVLVMHHTVEVCMCVSVFGRDVCRSSEQSCVSRAYVLCVCRDWVRVLAEVSLAVHTYVCIRAAGRRTPARCYQC